MITGSQIEEFLSYDPETGNFYWKKSRHNQMLGSIAGSHDDKGYVAIKFAGRSYKAHRLAWVYVNGKWPDGDLDHVNGDRSDNRIANLRLATRSQNLWNKKRTIKNKSGLKGVVWRAHERKWYASIKNAGKSIHLGSFDEPEKAHAAYCEAARRLFGEFARFA